MIQIKKFNESIESERQIIKLSEDCIPLLAQQVYDGLDYSRRNNRDIEGSLLNRNSKGYSLLVDFEDVRRIPKDLQDAVQDKHIILYVGVGATERNVRGLYKKESVVLYLQNQRIIEDIIEAFYKYNQESRVVNIIERKLRDSVLSTLIHEITHAYDDYISKGKYISGDYVQPEDSIDDYLSQNLEVNARYSSAIAKLSDFGIKYTGEFKDVIDNFKQWFDGWNTISKDQQERLIKRLYAWYTEPITSKREQKKALQYIYNNASFTQLYEIGDSTLKKLNNNDVEIPNNLKSTDFGKIDVVSYIQESARQLIDGSYDKKQFTNPSIVRNRYKGFSVIKHLIDMIQSLEQDLEKAEPGSSKYETLQKFLTEKIQQLQNIGEQIDATQEELQIIAGRFE